MEILIPILVVSAIGLLCGIGLSVASSVMAVKEDERFPAVRECLPGANCGACGFTGCDGYAKALAEGSAAANLCVPGGASTAKQLGEVLGVSVEAAERMVAFVHCSGTCENTTRKYDYKGIPTCAGAKLFYGGDGACSSGCLGYGDCAKVCPSNAIYNNNGVACVDPEKCTGCGLCTKACPNFVIRLVPTTATAVVACSNKDKGAAAVKECKASCIGCKKCENICPADAIKVEDNFAHIDYTKCVHCNACIETCPRHAIKNVEFSQAQ